MTIKEFHLLDIIIYENGKEIYHGKSEDAPEELKGKQIKIEKIQDKSLEVSVIWFVLESTKVLSFGF